MLRKKYVSNSIRCMILGLASVVMAAAFAEDGATKMLVFNIDDLSARNAKSKLPYLEFLRVESMSAYIYELAAGATDEQTPHDQDEIYYVVSGQAEITVDKENSLVKKGDIFYVKKYAEHKFHNISEDLKLLVVFAPPDTD